MKAKFHCIDFVTVVDRAVLQEYNTKAEDFVKLHHHVIFYNEDDGLFTYCVADGISKEFMVKFLEDYGKVAGIIRASKWSARIELDIPYNESFSQEDLAIELARMIVEMVKDK